MRADRDRSRPSRTEPETRPPSGYRLAGTVTDKKVFTAMRNCSTGMRYPYEPALPGAPNAEPYVRTWSEFTIPAA